MSTIGRVLDLVLGKTFALVIMSVLAVVMAIITIVESSRINPPTPFPWYQSPWFFGLLALFMASIFVVCLRYDQLRVSRWPQLFIHFGLVTLLIGGLMSYLGGVRGYLDIEENSTIGEYEGETTLLVIEKDGLRRRVDLGDLEDAEGRKVKGPTGAAYEVTGVLSSARASEDGASLVADPTGRGREAVRVRSGEGGEAVWLAGEGPARKIGDASLRVTRSRPFGFTVTLLDAREIRWPASRIPRAYYSTIRIDDPDEGYSREFLVETNAPFVYKGFRFYQSGMPSATRSVFQVTRDPGLIWVILGISAMGLGMIVLYALRFVRDPLAARRRRRSLLETPPTIPAAAGEVQS